MTPELIEEETVRLRQICTAAVEADWEAFCSLSDEPFSNEANMLEQFEESSDKLEEWSGHWTLSAHVGRVADGVRLIFGEAKSEMDKRPIKIILHTQLEGDTPQIGIWAFYYDIDWDDFHAAK